MIQSLSSKLIAYAPNWPTGVVEALAISAVGSFTVTLLLSGGNVPVAAAGAALSVVACAIDALIRPLMNKVFESPDKTLHLLCNSIVVAALTSVVAPQLKPILGLAVAVNVLHAAALQIALRFAADLATATPRGQKADPWLWATGVVRI